MSTSRPWAPPHNQDQSCAFCGVGRPAFAHRLDPAQVQFRMFGKGYTLPTFWCTCTGCEALTANGDDDGLLRLLAREEADDAARRGMLAAFRAADLGGEPLAEGPPDTFRP